MINFLLNIIIPNISVISIQTKSILSKQPNFTQVSQTGTHRHPPWIASPTQPTSREAECGVCIGRNTSSNEGCLLAECQLPIPRWV